MDLRRQFEPLPHDAEFLADYALPWETIVDRDQWVLIHNFRVFAGYNVDSATCAVRLATGYPDAQLDMVYFHPHLARADGQSIGALTGGHRIDGIDFQQWSRHRKPNEWIPGVDSLESHIMLVERWLEREFEK